MQLINGPSSLNAESDNLSDSNASNASINSERNSLKVRHDPLFRMEAQIL